MFIINPFSCDAFFVAFFPFLVVALSSLVPFHEAKKLKGNKAKKKKHTQNNDARSNKCLYERKRSYRFNVFFSRLCWVLALGSYHHFLRFHFMLDFLLAFTFLYSYLTLTSSCVVHVHDLNVCDSSFSVCFVSFLFVFFAFCFVGFDFFRSK